MNPRRFEIVENLMKGFVKLDQNKLNRVLLQRIVDLELEVQGYGEVIKNLEQEVDTLSNMVNILGEKIL